MTQPDSDRSHTTTPPQTGVAEIDQALAQLNLTGPVSEHHHQLSAAVEVLQQVLRNPVQ